MATDKDAERMLRGMIRVGTVCDQNPAECSARVTFEDKDNMPSPELKILTRGSGNKKDYWMPDIGDQVVCIFANNDKNFSSGWILGSFFSAKAPPQVANSDIMRIDFGDGSYIEHDRASGNLTITCKGVFTLNSKDAYLN